MGNPLSPVIANIFMSKLEADVVTPQAPPFYDRYVDDIFTKKSKNESDELLESMNCYHENIKFTVEENPTHFLDTELHFTENSFSTSVFRKPGKLPVHWSSQVPRNWKKNAILTSLHRAKRIASSWESEVRKIKEIFSKAAYPMWFINKTINDFIHPTSYHETILPTQWFDDRKSINIEIPFCKSNEDETKKLINKLTFFTQGHFKFRIFWRTRKIRSLFKLKDKTNHPSSVVYYGACTSCNSAYVGESARNFSIRQAEHEDTEKLSEPARHSAANPGHTFQWKILALASSWIFRRTLEAIFIAKLTPNLNKQVHSFHLILFPNGIT